VLRRCENKNETVLEPVFEVVGDCYAEGWMDEVTEESPAPEWIDKSLI
jgi:hypothetical protein